jgi:NAD(P)-dependent dehydrogenase (short-subunit alcohol dehydrogenase family)
MELMVADFTSFESVRSLASDYVRSHDVLHVLVNNAGLVKVRRTLTVDGFETTFQVNYLSHFLLTNLLLGVLRKGAPSRIVNVSSLAHYDGHLDFDDLQLERNYGVMRAYSESKLALVLFTRELSKRLDGTGVTANCLHPGAIATNIWGNQLGPARPLARVLRLVMPGATEGAETPVYLASSPDVETVTGKYFEKKKAKEPAPASLDASSATRLWEVSEVMVGLRRSP